MLTRIVKMTFQPDKVDDFVGLFNEMKEQIASFEGCKELHLMRSVSEDHVMFTISKWDNEQHLNVYRNSEFFQNTWSRAKLLFATKAEAWSLSQVV